MWNVEKPGPDHEPAPAPSRINVAVTDTMLCAIDRVIDNDHVSLTEAVRRLLCFGEFVYGLQQTPGRTLFVRDEFGREQEVVAA